MNVQALPTLRRTANGAEFIELEIARTIDVASTTDGRFFLRVGDTCVPVVGDDVLRLADERPALPWETMSCAARGEPRYRLSSPRLADPRIGSGQRVKEKSDAEILDHYGLVKGQLLPIWGRCSWGHALIG